MENASKALIIAGAILLSILIIAIGMYIYNSSQNSINEAASQISAQEVQSFNQTWEMYEGAQSGSNVRSLISKMSSNAKINEDEESKIVGLYYEPEYKNQSGNGTWCPVHKNNIIPEFNKARTSIQTKHTYYVIAITDPKTSLITAMFVNYNKTEIKEFKDGAVAIYNWLMSK